MSAELERLVAAGDVEAATALCEAFELDLGHADAAPLLSLTVYKVHLLAYLLANNVNEARFLWKRMPAEVRADAEIAALWEVGKCMWKKNLPAVQQTTRSFSWSLPLLATLINKLQQNVLEASFKSIGAAYSLISGPVLAQNLGVDQETAHKLAVAAGWEINAELGYYTPTNPKIDKHRNTNLDQLQTLTDYVAHVEYEVG